MRLTLTASCDIVLSLHRSGGFGLVLVEAMLLGRPMIATDPSHNMAFMKTRPGRAGRRRLTRDRAIHCALGAERRAIARPRLRRFRLSPAANSAGQS